MYFWHSYKHHCRLSVIELNIYYTVFCLPVRLSVGHGKPRIEINEIYLACLVLIATLVHRSNQQRILQDEDSTVFWLG